MTVTQPAPGRAGGPSPAGTGWVALRRHVPGLTGQPPRTLLALSARLAGNLRYGTPDGKEIVLLGETWGEGRPSGEPAGPGAADPLTVKQTPDTPVAGDLVEAGLDASGFAWTRRETGWAVPAGPNLPREIEVRPTAGGLRVEAVLAGWDEVGGVEGEALALVLCRAQLGLRFARCELDDRQARVAALVHAGCVERELPHALGGVAAGTRLLCREVGALLGPEVARAVLAFLGGAGHAGHAGP